MGGWVGEDRWAGTGWGIYEDRDRQGWMNGYAGEEVFGGLGILYWGAEKSRILLTYPVEVYMASVGWRWSMLVVLWRCSVL